eukprot:scaffold20944_cov106-Isochrysis_galbana.AAC.5
MEGLGACVLAAFGACAWAVSLFACESGGAAAIAIALVCRWPTTPAQVRGLSVFLLTGDTGLRASSRTHAKKRTPPPPSPAKEGGLSCGGANNNKPHVNDDRPPGR